jgi:hypothetical protein
MKEKLKIGILLEDHIIPSWEFKIVEDIHNSDFAVIVLVILNKGDQRHAENKGKQSYITLLKLLEKADRLVFKREDDHDLRKDLSELIHDIPLINISSISEYSSENTSGHIFREIASHGLDIILKFGSHILNTDILKTANYGILTNSIDHQKTFWGISPGFWEVVSNSPVTPSALFLLKEKLDDYEVVFCSMESTCYYSINVNRNNVYWRTSLFMPRLLYGLHRSDHSFLSRQATRFRTVNKKTDPYDNPYSLLKTLQDLFHYIKIAALTLYKKVFYTDAFNWQVLIEINNDYNYLSPDFRRFQKLVSPKEVFWADPFAVTKDDNYFVFVEEFVYKLNKAHISVLKLDKKGNLLSSERIIERPYHMSYPFIFELDNIYYMIPETGKNQTIELYKCTDFPYKWEFEKNLMENVSAVDSTVFFYNNKWWLFTCLDQTINISGNSTELFLFFSDDLFADRWESHPDNPILSDARTARPAGKLFIHEDKIYRPSQNCAGRYGMGFNINQVTKLTEDEYGEILISETEPFWDVRLKGTHTFNSDKDLKVIDVYSYRERINFYG